MKVKYTFITEIPDNEISESNDVIKLGYAAIYVDYNKADGVDDFNLEFEVLE